MYPIPKSIKVGTRRYNIELVDRSGALYYGQIVYHGNITLNKRTVLGPVQPERMRETLWHELTHAILYTMKSDLHRDEQFVSTFARHLNKAINSARF